MDRGSIGLVRILQFQPADEEVISLGFESQTKHNMARPEFNLWVSHVSFIPRRGLEVPALYYSSPSGCPLVAHSATFMN
jgi:hypothetical protein